MSMMLAEPAVSPAELLAMSDGKSYELVDSRLVEKNVGTLSALIEGMLYLRVALHCEQHNLGPVWTGTQGIQCFPGQPNKVRRPDVSFVKAARFAPRLLDTGFMPIAPDLVAEVISPGDLASEVWAKIDEYLRAGIALVWLIDPGTRVVMIFRQDGTAARLRETDELLGEDVLPGFRCLVADLFPARAEPTA